MTMKLDEGCVTITIGDRSHTLKPTLAALTTLTRLHGDMTVVREAILRQNIDVWVNVIRYGAGMSDKDARALPERLFKHGLFGELAGELFNFVVMLTNGGKPLEPETDDGEPAEGNA